MNPPGSANALMLASSTTWNSHGNPGRSVLAAREWPMRFTYACSVAFGYNPMVAETSAAPCRPISISCDSEISAISRLPVTGLVAQESADDMIRRAIMLRILQFLGWLMGTCCSGQRAVAIQDPGS
jgi:hypothetical protein